MGQQEIPLLPVLHAPLYRAHTSPAAVPRHPALIDELRQLSPRRPHRSYLRSARAVPFRNPAHVQIHSVDIRKSHTTTIDVDIDIDNSSPAITIGARAHRQIDDVLPCAPARAFPVSAFPAAGHHGLDNRVRVADGPPAEMRCGVAGAEVGVY